MNKENELKDTIKNLQSMVEAVVPLDVSVDQACKVVRTKVLTPLNLTIAQRRYGEGLCVVTFKCDSFTIVQHHHEYSVQSTFHVVLCHK